MSGIGSGVLEGFTLAGALGVENVDIGGWSQFGWTDDFVPRSRALHDGLAFLDSPNRFNLHQQWFYMAKEADGSKGFDVGGRVDIMYGVDASATQAFGNPAGSWDFQNGWDRNGGYGWALPQLYGEIAMGDLSVIIGHFYTLVGYEVVPAPDNFFFSHSLTMFNSEPFTHTGVLGTYSGFENMTLYGGWTLGWDTGFDNQNSGNNWLGGFSASLTDDVTLTYINTYGNFGARDGGQDDSYSHSVVIDVTLTDNINYVFQTDMVAIDPINDAGGAVALNDQVGINQYLFYTWNDIISFGSRMEWWKSEGVSNYAYTTGVNIKLLDNLVIRPETRRDWTPGGVATGDPFANTSRTNYACDMILTY
ncbi:MAG: porin [Proteobacteria bacterium]|nr:porin [Pseudomonadota bacterium]